MMSPYLAFLFRTINALIAAPLALEFGLGAGDLGLLTSVYFLTRWGVRSAIRSRRRAPALDTASRTLSRNRLSDGFCTQCDSPDRGMDMFVMPRAFVQRQATGQQRPSES